MNVPDDLIREVTRRLTHLRINTSIVEAVLDIALNMDHHWIHDECMPKEDYDELVEDAEATDQQISNMEVEKEKLEARIAELKMYNARLLADATVFT